VAAAYQQFDKSMNPSITKINQKWVMLCPCTLNQQNIEQLSDRITFMTLLAHELTDHRKQPLAAECRGRLYLTALFGQLGIMQLAGKVNQEAASVAIQTPLWSTDRVQH